MRGYSQDFSEQSGTTGSCSRSATFAERVIFRHILSGSHSTADTVKIKSLRSLKIHQKIRKRHYTVQPWFSERQSSGKPRINGNSSDDELFI